MTYSEAAALLGIHYVSVHRVRRKGDIKQISSRQLDDASVHAYLDRMNQPEGYIKTSDAASRLGIPAREMSQIAKLDLVDSRPRLGGGFWVRETDVVELSKHPERLAVLGMVVPPPEGFLNVQQASKRIGCSPSWVSRLARGKLLRRRLYGTHNSWFLEEDVNKYAADRKKRLAQR